MCRGAARTSTAAYDRGVRWTLRRGDVARGVVLAVTGHLARIDAIASRLSGQGIYTFAAVADAVPQLWNIANFDLLVLLGDVPATDRASITKLTPPVGERLLVLDPTEETRLIDLVTARLAKR